MSQPHALNCPSCTAILQYDGRAETIRCEYCGSTIIVPESLKQSSSTPGIMGDEDPMQAASIHEILHLVQQGKKIEAIKLYRSTFGVSLAEAKEAVDHLDHGQPTAIIISSGAAAAATTTAASTGCGCLLPIIIFLIVAGVGVAAFFASNPDQFSRLSESIASGDFSQVVEDVSTTLSNQAVFEEPILLNKGGDGVPPDLLLEIWTYGGEEIPVAVANTTFSDGRRQILWQTKVGNSGNNDYHTGFDDQKIYIALNTSLQAHDRDSGEVLWETVMSDEINSSCTVCLRTVKDKVIILTTDNTLEAFDTNTGRSVWQVRLQDQYFSYPDAGQAAFALVGDKVAILDEVEVGSRSETALNFYDIDTGEAVQQIQPRCPDVDNFFDDDTIDHDTQLYLDEETGEMIVLFGTAFVGQMCLQKWDAASGELMLEARLPEGFEHATSVPGGLITGQTNFPYGQMAESKLITTLEMTDADDNRHTGLVKFDLAAGDIIFQATDEDYELAPIGEVDGILLVWAERQRGTKQHEIWGIESASGERLWKHIIQADYLYELDPFDDRFSYQLQPDGLVVLQLLTDEDPSMLVVQKLNPADGSLLYDTETPMTEDFWRGLVWANDQAYLTTRQLVVVDLATGETAVEWP